MRNDEVFMMNSIEKEFISVNYSDYHIYEGEDPPDYYLSINDTLISIELTQCKPAIKMENSIDSAANYSTPILHFFDLIDREFEHKIADNTCFFVVVKFPISNWTKFKKEFRNQFSKLLDSNLCLNDSGILDMNGEIIKWHYLERTGKKIVAGAMAKNDMHVFDIEMHIQQILFKAIKIKNTKMKNLIKPNIDEHWLGIYNDYFLAELDVYKNVLTKLKMDIIFNKIFIINSDEKVLIFNCV